MIDDWTGTKWAKHPYTYGEEPWPPVAEALVPYEPPKEEEPEEEKKEDEKPKEAVVLWMESDLQMKLHNKKRHNHKRHPNHRHYLQEDDSLLQLDSNIGASSLLQAFQNPAVKEKHQAVHAALKHLLMQTATVPLTEGNKMQMRHLSFALSQHFGSLKLFMTNNFADTYGPLTLVLYDAGSGDTIGTAGFPMLMRSAWPRTETPNFGVSIKSVASTAFPLCPVNQSVCSRSLPRK